MGGGTYGATVRPRFEPLGHDEPVQVPRSDYVPFQTHILIRRGTVCLVPVGSPSNVTRSPDRPTLPPGS